LGKKQVEEAPRLNLSKNVGITFENARQFHDGRWLYIKVETEQDIDDIKKLLRAKVKPIKNE
jgi:2'-5' RNA ligase